MRTEDQLWHDVADGHRAGSRLSDVILGGQDGLVNVLGVLLGVAAATHDTRIVLAAGLAATFAESISMAAVAYTTRRSDAALYQAERERELRHIRKVPHIEREEIRAMYAKKGFEGALLDRIVETLTQNEDVWLAVMMEEEHKLPPVTLKRSFSSAFVVGVAATVGSLIPLVPFLLFPVRTGIWVSLGVAALSLFVFGLYKAKRTVGSLWASGLELTAIGLLSAVAGYAVGLLFQPG